MSEQVRLRRRSKVAVAGVWLIWVAAVIGGAIRPDGASIADVPIIAGYALFLGVGSILVLRVPDNTVSWIVLALGAATGSLALTSSIMDTAKASGMDGVHQLFYYLNGASLFGIVVLAGSTLPLSFPTGSPPTPRWRWAGVSAVAGYATILFTVPMVRIVYGFEAAKNVAEGNTGLLGTVQFVAMALLLIGIAGSVVSLAVRWHRSEGEERAQLQWLVPTFVIFGIGLIAEFGGGQDTLVAVVFLALGVVLVPISIAFAITKYRLYDIGKIVSRTVTYAILAGLIAGAYALGALWLPTQLGIDNPTFVAVTTLAIAMAFNPVRRWLTSHLDRRFNRTPYDPQAVVDGLTAELRDTTDASAISDAWATTVQSALHPSTISVWTPE